ncbi:MAG: hypothetical protein WA632_00365 [Gallionella sp.]
MNEEQAVLDFFSRTENLPLALSVADELDKLRSEMNNRYWHDLHQRLKAMTKQRRPDWSIELTEDKNSAENIVGLHCNPNLDQDLFLRPMMEQQYLGEYYRIYFGLMWSVTPTQDLLQLAEVKSLRGLLARSGLQENTSYLGWQWTRLHPRRRDFLLRYTRDPEALLTETESIIKVLLAEHIDAIALANSALGSAPRSKVVSLDLLHSKRVI